MSENSSAADAQARIVAFLASPAAHGGAQPAHIETHLSHLSSAPRSR